MDTGGKVATGILVPLAVVGAAVGGYLLLRGSKKSDGDFTILPKGMFRGTPSFFDDSSRPGKPIGPKRHYTDNIGSYWQEAGKRRRTHRRRR